MTDKNLTEIIAIVDRSGSMEPIAHDAIGGFNSFLEKQKKDVNGKCLFTYVHFDHEYELVHDGIDIQDMQPLDKNTYVPRGSTALRDAIGRTINTVGERYLKTPEEKRPGNVVVVILTDGEENASVEFQHEQIRQMIQHQTEKYDWGFIYLAQNVDAFATGRNIGIDMSNPNMFAGNVKTGGQAMRAAYNIASSAISDRRDKAMHSVSMDWSSQDKRGYTETLDTGDESEASAK